MTGEALWLFVLACAAIVVVPGPTVTVIVANSLARGVKAGLLNVLGTQIGLALMVAVLAFGFGIIVEQLAGVFDVLRWLGAAYLIWLGWKLWRADGASLALADSPTGSSRTFGYVMQGFLVIWSNPKALFFFGAFIPQFVDPTRPAAAQVLLLGVIFMLVSTVLDFAWVLLAARLAQRIGPGHARVVERASGTCLAGGGLWLLAAGRGS